MPEEEVAYLAQAYQDAHVILEYGSGGSTRLAAGLLGKFVMSVESDPDWMRSLRRDLVDAVSPVILYYADIGPVGPWGRPLSDRGWRGFHRYPNSVWDQPWFREPDTVLIDGRFRTACFATVLMRTEKPVRVLFDDYGLREKYQLVERILKPSKIVGRLAEFSVLPDAYSKSELSFLVGQFFEGTIHGQSEEAYKLPSG